MKIGFRTPSLKKRIAARTSLKRVVRHSLGLKTPRGWGWLTNPKRAAYNRVYNRTTIGCGTIVLVFLVSIFTLFLLVFSAFARDGGSGHVRVGSHTKRSGTRVSSYYRTRADHTRDNNWPTRGEYESNTGKKDFKNR
jgi:hypothetical protein